jgi:hypothetical protein
MVSQITSSNIGVKAEYGGVTGHARSLVDVAWPRVGATPMIFGDSLDTVWALVR